MSMNVFMHPRNVYRTPPDFTQLAVEYPDIRTVGSLDINGKVRLDFKNEKTLRTLTECLLRRDFGLKVLLPDDKLIPTLPLRLNYILWLEDILQTSGIEQTNQQFTGIDIGCGASCVYPLLAATKNKWNMYGLESNGDSFLNAQKNVEQNELQLRITVLKQLPDDPIFDRILNHLKDTKTIADFCMCNPPFFSSSDDLINTNTKHSKQNRSGKRPLPRAIQTGCTDELVVSGGEIEFVRRIINQSRELKDRIRIYTTMLGHKDSVSKVMQMLRDSGITNVGKTEFCQGHTTRWGVAWSFIDTIRLKGVPSYGPSSVKTANKNNSYSFNISGNRNCKDVQENLVSILNSINLSIEDSHMIDENLWSGKLITSANTWSKQRRKRREIDREQTQKLDSFGINLQLEAASNASLYDSHNEPKRRRLEETSLVDEPILVANIKILHIKDTTTQKTAIDLEFVSGSGGRNGAYQLMQFIQNNIK